MFSTLDLLETPLVYDESSYPHDDIEGGNLRALFANMSIDDIAMNIMNLTEREIVTV